MLDRYPWVYEFELTPFHIKFKFTEEFEPDEPIPWIRVTELEPPPGFLNNPVIEIFNSN